MQQHARIGVTLAGASAAAGKGDSSLSRASASASSSVSPSAHSVGSGAGAASASGVGAGGQTVVGGAGASGHTYRLKRLVMGRWEMGTWYEAPYPPEFVSIPTLYVCEFCLRYFRCAFTYERHSVKCVWKHPPGCEIYRRNRFSYWQVDGAQVKVCARAPFAPSALSSSNLINHIHVVYYFNFRFIQFIRCI